MKQMKQEALNHYTKIIEEMDKLNMTKEEQIEYLKSRLLYLEYKSMRKNRIERLLFLGFFFVLIGFYLISIKLYLLGFLCMLLPGIYISYKIITFAEENSENMKESERKKLVSLLNSNLEQESSYFFFCFYFIYDKIKKGDDKWNK